MMLKYLLAVILSAYATQANSDAFFGMDISPMIAQQQNAMRMVMRTYSEKLAPSDAEVVASNDIVYIDNCFNYYFNQEQAISTAYNEKYSDCITTAENAKESLSAFSAGQREDLVSRGQAVCSQLSKCESLTDGLDFFECYSGAANDNIQSLYGISSDSDSEASYLKIQYAKIDNDQNTCTKTAYNKYVIDMSKTNTDLQACLRGDAGPPTTVSPDVSLPTVSETTTTGEVTDTTSAEVSETTESASGENSTDSDSTIGDSGEDSTVALPEEINPEPMPEEDIRAIQQTRRNKLRRVLRTRLE